MEYLNLSINILNSIAITYLLFFKKKEIKKVVFKDGIAWYDDDNNLIVSTKKL